MPPKEARGASSSSSDDIAEQACPEQMENIPRTQERHVTRPSQRHRAHIVVCKVTIIRVFGDYLDVISGRRRGHLSGLWRPLDRCANKA